MPLYQVEFAVFVGVSPSFKCFVPGGGKTCYGLQFDYCFFQSVGTEDYVRIFWFIGPDNVGRPGGFLFSRPFIVRVFWSLPVCERFLSRLSGIDRKSVV